MGAETQAPAVVEGPPLGRLLFFDPTDSYVPAGYLPEYLQASLALVGAAESSGLVRLPLAPAHGTRRREIKAELKDNGSISGSFVEEVTGESFVESVRAWRENSREQYARMVERWIGLSIPGAAAEVVEVTEQNGELTRKARFTSDRFAQRPQAGMILFRAAVMRDTSARRLAGSVRKYPVMISGDALEETVQIRLPEGYKVDELPDPVHIASPFGKYDAKWNANNGSIEFARTIDLEPQTVPASQYAGLRHFLDAAYGSSNLPVVLVKK